MTDGAWSALVGILSYAIGSTQFIVVDWHKKRSEHRRQLRQLRAELFRLATFNNRFNYAPLDQPDTITPALPVLSNAFIPTVAAIDWELTDEHPDDNAQQALLMLEDAIRRMSEAYANVFKRGDELSESMSSPEAFAKAQARVKAYADKYDEIVAQLETMVHDGIREMNRRLGELGNWTQLKRWWAGELPPGHNPPPITGPNDPRVLAPKPEL